MLTIKILENWLEASCGWLHGHTRRSLARAVSGLLAGGKLTVTGIGRSLPGDIDEKHKVKQVDRVLGNRALQRGVQGIYGALLERLKARRGWLPILVDWTSSANQDFVLLEAAVPMAGRAISVYHQVHRLSVYKNSRVQRLFLQRLAQVVGPHKRVVVVADAGFQRSFFEEVEALGWSWVVRLGGPLMVRPVGSPHWQPLETLQDYARSRPRSLGQYELRKGRCYQARVCVVAPPAKGRRDRPDNREHGHGTMAKRYRKLYRGPWLLASNLPPTLFRAEDIAALYAQRMQIEQTFRDVKSHRFGYGMDYHLTRSCARLAVLRLIGALATFLICLIGLAAECHGWARGFQVNTESGRRVLSLFYLGRRVLRSTRYRIRLRDLTDSLRLLRKLTHYQPLIA